MRQIALDLRAHLKPGEVFSAGDWYTYTAGDVPYYAIDDKGRFLYPEVWDPYQGPDRIDEFINDRVAKTKVALLWKEDVAQVSKSVMCHSRRPMSSTERFIVGSTGRGAPTCLLGSTRSISLATTP